MDIFEAEMARRFVVAVEKIANALDRKTEPQKNCDNCGTPRDKCVYCIEEDRMWTPKTEPQTSGVVWTEDAIKNEPESYTTWASTDEPQRGYMWTCPKCGTENHSDFTKCPCCGEPKDEPQKKEVEWVYNKRERLWYPYSNGELLFKDEPTISKMEQVKDEQTERSRR